jgi:hypothetical protein
MLGRCLEPQTGRSTYRCPTPGSYEMMPCAQFHLWVSLFAATIP